MSASVAIVLDTTAPTLVLGPVTYPTGAVRVDLVIDESAVVAGDFVAADGARTAGVLDGSALVFEVGLAAGIVEAEAVDLVGNRGTSTLSIGVSAGRVIAYVARRVIGTIARVASAGATPDASAEINRSPPGHIER